MKDEGGRRKAEGGSGGGGSSLPPKTVEGRFPFCGRRYGGQMGQARNWGVLVSSDVETQPWG